MRWCFIQTLLFQGASRTIKKIMFKAINIYLQLTQVTYHKYLQSKEWKKMCLWSHFSLGDVLKIHRMGLLTLHTVTTCRVDLQILY